VKVLTINFYIIVEIGLYFTYFLQIKLDIEKM